MIVIGLTGSIGMGKTTTAAMFEKLGVPVHDADAVVHQLYDAEAAPAIEAVFPGVCVEGRVDRRRLGQQLAGDSDKFAQLEAIVHPLVRQREQHFLDYHRCKNAKLVLLDIPLLFETGGDKRVDKIVVVSASAQIQRERVLARAGMNIEKFEQILARQMPDDQKRMRADFVVDTGKGLDFARNQVRQIVDQLLAST